MDSSEIYELSKALRDKIELMNTFSVRMSKRCLLPNGCWLVMQTSYQTALHIGKKYVIIGKHFICTSFDQYVIKTSILDTAQLHDDEEIALFIQSVQFILADIMIIRIIQEHVGGSSMYIDKNRYY